jgi:hypothetical protein
MAVIQVRVQPWKTALKGIQFGFTTSLRQFQSLYRYRIGICLAVEYQYTSLIKSFSTEMKQHINHFLRQTLKKYCMLEGKLRKILTYPCSSHLQVYGVGDLSEIFI